MAIALWENILATKQEFPQGIQGQMAIVGIDYTKINDFAAAGFLTRNNGKICWKHKTWVCRNSADLPCIRYPLREAEEAGELEFVDGVEIDTDLIADWIGSQMQQYSVHMLAIDDYRYQLLERSLARYGFSVKNGNIKLVRPSDRIKVEPIIDSAFRNHTIIYGDSSLMRWYTNNTEKVKSKKYGNYAYQKNEAKCRKTEGFFAFVAAMTQVDLLSEKAECPSCGKLVPEMANFCGYCGKKIKETCTYCWVRKKDNYNCGESNCPGYGLFRLEKSKTE